MMLVQVADVLRGKKIQDLLAVRDDATVADAVKLMVRNGVGAVLIRRGKGPVEGIFTERDVMRRVLDEGRDANTTPVGAVMSREVRCVPSTATLEDALRLMIEHGHRHVLVEDETSPKGLLSIRDLMSLVVMPDEPIAHEGRGGVIRARAEDTIRAIQDAG